jgi:hypothetical protein
MALTDCQVKKRFEILSPPGSVILQCSDGNQDGRDAKFKALTTASNGKIPSIVETSVNDGIIEA